jgi:sterol desaturase/sphingolipid hydroxylase (fatty acid hydroxylase superfamily)
MLSIFAVTGALMFLGERLRPRRAQSIFRRGVFADALYVPVHFCLRVFVNFFVAGLLTRAGREIWRGNTGLLEGLPVLVQALVVLLVLDLAFYAMHRLKHRWTWWWRFHETHHSSETLDWLASVRFHPVEKLLDRLIFLVPLTVLGASDAALVIWSGVDVFFGMLNHSNIDLKLGPLNYVFVGPELHLQHHAKGVEGEGCNFGNNLSIFDWMFGTARLAAAPPAEFGVDEPTYPQSSILGQFLFAFRRLRPADASALPGRSTRQSPSRERRAVG